MFSITPNDVGAFLGGLFTTLLIERALGAKEGLTAEEWASQRAGIYERAFDGLLENFPEPLKSKLRAGKADFIANGLQLS